MQGWLVNAITSVNLPDCEIITSVIHRAHHFVVSGCYVDQQEMRCLYGQHIKNWGTTIIVIMPCHALCLSHYIMYTCKTNIYELCLSHKPKSGPNQLMLITL